MQKHLVSAASARGGGGGQAKQTNPQDWDRNPGSFLPTAPEHPSGRGQVAAPRGLAGWPGANGNTRRLLPHGRGGGGGSSHRELGEAAAPSPGPGEDAADHGQRPVRRRAASPPPAPPQSSPRGWGAPRPISAGRRRRQLSGETVARPGTKAAPPAGIRPGGSAGGGQAGSPAPARGRAPLAAGRSRAGAGRSRRERGGPGGGRKRDPDGLLLAPALPLLPGWLRCSGERAPRPGAAPRGVAAGETRCPGASLLPARPGPAGARCTRAPSRGAPCTCGEGGSAAGTAAPGAELARRLHPILANDDLASVIHVFVSSRLDRSRPVDLDIEPSALWKLHALQTAAEHLLSCTGSCEHSQPGLHSHLGLPHRLLTPVHGLQPYRQGTQGPGPKVSKD
ncbi:translation initiation factor IF-2-like [Dermochelys coriacea]|uniref:translation initiation factor IF-2-like n=1 Tax=Dermochelys coriacea TaxID=27794 RepID=UPI001CA8ED0A|nr:translation initiation factor IF-2-like [Dermochelys coriacea]